jgi:hypothetical protein
VPRFYLAPGRAREIFPSICGGGRSQISGEFVEHCLHLSKQLQGFLARLPRRKATNPSATALCSGEQSFDPAQCSVAELGHVFPIRAAATAGASKRRIRKLTSPFTLGKPVQFVARQIAKGDAPTVDRADLVMLAGCVHVVDRVMTR